MANIQKRGEKYYVVYYYTDENGNRKQKWEKFDTKSEAVKRKAEVELAKCNGNLVVKQPKTVEEFMTDFVQTYGQSRWGFSMYNSQTGLIRHYVNPIIGNKKLQDISPSLVEHYISKLSATPPVSGKYRKARTQYLTPATIEKIIKLCRTAFKEAKRLDYIARNPFENCNCPKVMREERKIWHYKEMKIALDTCKDMRLFLAMNLSVACSLRIGECLGLTWDNVDISEKAISTDDACIYIEHGIIRASKESVKQVGTTKKTYQVYPNVMPNSKSVLLSKKPKTKKSQRKIWLPGGAASILQQWKTEQEKIKNLLGSEYEDYNLVIAQDNGRPCESSMIRKAFYRLQEEQGLPRMVFHSIRHFSLTYKMTYCNGSPKAVQGDAGHANSSTTLDIYTHSIDEERKKLAGEFNEQFYGKSSALEKKETDTGKSLVKSLLQEVSSDSALREELATLFQKETSIDEKLEY